MTDDEKLALLNEWLRHNDERIGKARRVALMQIPELASAMQDDSLKDDAKRRDRAQMIEFNSRAVLAELMAEAMGNEFSDLSPPLRKALVKQAESITREHLVTFIDAIIKEAVV